MNTYHNAAAALLAALLATPVPAAGEEAGSRDKSDGDAIEEIVVSGRQLSLRDASIVVEQEFVVDVADALSRLPGANRNQNGRLSGIAQ